MLVQKHPSLERKDFKFRIHVMVVKEVGKGFNESGRLHLHVFLLERSTILVMKAVFTFSQCPDRVPAQSLHGVFLRFSPTLMVGVLLQSVCRRRRQVSAANVRWPGDVRLVSRRESSACGSTSSSASLLWLFPCRPSLS